MQFQNPAAGKPAHQRFPHGGRIRATFGCQQQRLRHSPDGDPHNRLIGQLCQLTGPHRPDAGAFAQRIEHRQSPLDIGFRAARHDTQTSLGRTHRAARYRCIDITGPLLCGQLGMFPRQRRLHRTHIDHQRTRLHRSHSTLLHQHIIHHLAIFQHGDHDIGLRHRLGGRPGDRRFAGKGLAFAGGAIPERHGKTGVQQVTGHRRAHQADAEKSDTRRMCKHFGESHSEARRRDWGSLSKNLRSHGWRSRSAKWAQPNDYEATLHATAERPQSVIAGRTP